MKISVYTAYHKIDGPIYRSEVHKPIAVGRRLPQIELQDSSGDSITKLNWLYCELTATYWAWRNDAQSDFIGLAHYRRYLSSSASWPVHLKRVGVGLLEKSKFARRRLSYFYYPRVFAESESRGIPDQLATCDDCICEGASSTGLIIPHEALIFGTDVRGFYSRVIPCNFFDCISSHLNGSSLAEPFKRELSGASIFPCNMFVMDRETFRSYAKFLFDSLLAIQGPFIGEDAEGRNSLMARSFGYLGEILTSCYIRYLIEDRRRAATRLFILQLT